MSGAREEILARVRYALGDVPDQERPDDVAVGRGYRHTTDEPTGALVMRLEERLRDYRAEVARVDAEGIAEAVTEICQRLGLRRLVVPGGVPEAWRPRAAEVVEDRGLGAVELDGLDGAITGCAVAIAETGTLGLDGQGVCGRRAITLVPDHHICVVEREQVVGSVPEAIARLADAAVGEAAPVTFISGPSASSDIELSRVEGVHGPRHLIVLLVDGASGA